jgi:hypothetical protein
MYNGILIDMDSNVLVTDRKIYSITNWAGEVGGFSKTVGVIIAVLFPLFSLSSIESFLTVRLYKQSPKMLVDKPQAIENPVK